MNKRYVAYGIILTLVGISLLMVINPIWVYSNKNTGIVVDVNRIKQDVEALASTDEARNYQNIHALNQAADYIKSEWEKLGVEVTEQKFNAVGLEYKNLICSFGPKDAERIIVGAHYDVCDEQEGADDNASGVAGILEIARLLKEHNPTLKYRIDLVAYSLEEPPFFRTELMGSHVHAQSLRQNEIPVRAMVCLEMIGYFSEEKGSQDYPLGLLKLFYPNKGNFITVVGKLRDGGITRQVKKNMIEGSDIDVRSINAPTSLPGIDFSDHLNYWKFGYRAIMVNNTAFYRNKNYHEVTDTPETLDYQKMAEVIEGVYWGTCKFRLIRILFALDLMRL